MAHHEIWKHSVSFLNMCDPPPPLWNWLCQLSAFFSLYFTSVLFSTNTHTHTRALTGISSKLLAQISRSPGKTTEKSLRGKKSEKLLCPHFFFLGSSWLCYCLFSCTYLQSSLPCFKACFDTLKVILHMPACSFFCQALQKYIGGRSDIIFLGEPQQQSVWSWLCGFWW